MVLVKFNTKVVDPLLIHKEKKPSRKIETAFWQFTNYQ